MNGRIYDPVLERFLQAAPVIQAPKNSQNYNRYSYVLNNPLSYTDPSGFNLFKSFVKLDGFLAGAFAGGGIVGGAIQSSINHNIHKWVANSQGLTATAGVVIGAFTTMWCGPCSIGFSALFSSNMAAYNGASSSEAFNGAAGTWNAQGGVAHIAAHSVAGGVIADLQGDKFGHGFFSAGVTKFAGGALPSGDPNNRPDGF